MFLCVWLQGQKNRISDQKPISAPIGKFFRNPPPTESISESEMWVMEKRDTLEGETLKREHWTAALGSGALWVERGGGESDATDDVGRGSSGKSSSHSYPAPDSGRWDGVQELMKYWHLLQQSSTYSPLRCFRLKSHPRNSLGTCSVNSGPPLLKQSSAQPAP